MKKWLIALAIVILAAAVLIARSAPSPNARQIVEFGDKNLESYLQGIFNKADEPIYVGDMEKLNSWLSLQGGVVGAPAPGGGPMTAKLENITGLEFARNLKRLSLSSNNIRDISPLASMKKLNALFLNDNQALSDISPLKSMANLFILHLSDNQISDLSPLASSSRLKTLTIASNNVTDISPLASLTDLELLDLQNNKISDVSALSNLNNIQMLLLQNNRITDISALVNLKQVRFISLWGNPLNEASLNTYIPQLEERGVRVTYK